MPANLSYPGVYVEEIPSGVRSIAGVATSIAAFIGRTLRGPVNQAVMINSYADFERIFGGLWIESSLGFAVRDFYLNGGAQAVIVRLYHAGAVSEDAKKQVSDAAQAVAAAAKERLDAADGGKAEIVAAARTKAAEFALNTPAREAADLIVAAVDRASGDTKRAANTAAQAAVAGAIDTVVQSLSTVSKAKLSLGGLNLEAASEGAWGNNLRVRVDHDFVDSQVAAEQKLFNLSVQDIVSGQVEQIRNLSVVPGHLRQADGVLRNESNLIRVQGALPSDRPPQSDANLLSDAAATDETKKQAAIAKLREQPFDVPDRSTAVTLKATDGESLDVNDFTGTGTAENKRGLYALEQADLFNLLIIPPYKQTPTGLDVDDDVVATAIAYCQKRRAMMIVDSPSDWSTKDQAKAGIDRFPKTANAAIFFPRLIQPNPLKNNQMEAFAASGAVAGVCARIDAQRGIWKAPAGLEATLLGVPQLSVALTDAENGELNPLGINCLRSIPAAGRIIWGARTLQGDDRLASEWKYLAVRRLALYLQESLYRGTQWVVFEPNDEPLWSQVRLNLTAFMNNLFRQGAFQGSTPREAYFVKCDKETTTQADIDRGVVNIIVGFAPLKPAEFVVLRFQQMAGQNAG